MNIAELNQVLMTSNAGEWIYAQTDSAGYLSRETIKVTNGLRDKAWLYMWGFVSEASIQKTQQVLRDVFARVAHQFTGKSPIAGIRDVELLNGCRQNLSKYLLAGGHTIQGVESEALSRAFSASSFNQEIKAMQSAMDLLYEGHPRFERLQELKQSFEGSHRTFQAHTNTQTWLEAAKALRDLKMCFTESVELFEYTPWVYSHNSWSFHPEKQLLKTAENFEKEIRYLFICPNINALLDRLETSSEFSVDAVVHEFLAKIQEFLEILPLSQRRPISLSVPGLPISRMGRQQNQKLLETLVTKSLELIGERPDLFVHQISLYKEAADVKVRGICLSRVTGGGAQAIRNSTSQTFTPSRELSRGTQALIHRLSHRERWEPDFLSPLNSYLYANSSDQKTPSIFRAFEIQGQLFGTEVGRNCILRIFGKQRGGHKEIFLEAFSYLRSMEDFLRSTGNFEQMGEINLDGFSFLETISSGHQEWVLNAICMYAYTREHPNLPMNPTPETEAAYRVYLQCIDYLNP